MPNFSPDWLTGAAYAGCGAWELAARLSFIDLDEGPIDGGQLENFTVGVIGYIYALSL